jgi:hypothetical protein
MIMTSQPHLRVSCRYETYLVNYDSTCKIIHELNKILQFSVTVFNRDKRNIYVRAKKL